MPYPTIFVSNDDETYLQLIQEVLTDAGYPKVVWHVGQGAFHILNPGRGWNTLDALKLHPKTRHIPVIICSTDMRMINEKAEMLRELHCQTLEKPFELETLIDKVAEAIGPPPT